MSHKFSNNVKNRRGISSVVGGLIFVVLMVATFSAVLLALNSQSDIVETNREVTNTELKKQQEQFGVDIFTNSSQHLFVDVDNFGQNPVEIYSLVITNSSDFDNDFPAKVHDIPARTSFVAAGFEENVIENTGWKLALAEAGSGDTVNYDFKVISELGTIKTGSVTCDEFTCNVSGPDSTLSAQLFLDGPNGINTKTSTVVMFISNTGSVPIEDVQPTAGWPSPIPDNGDCSGLLKSITTLPFPAQDNFVEEVTGCNVTPSSQLTLEPFQTTLFKWDMTIHGDIGAVFEFCNVVEGTHPDLGLISSNGGSESCDELEIIDPNDCDGCGPGGESIILIDDLLIRPSIFMAIPSPFGDATDADDFKGVWGVNVANPTDEEMKISKVTIVAYPPGGNAQDIVFSGTASGSNQCLEEDIHPGQGAPPSGYWDCPRDNTLMWQTFTDPLTLPANSTKTFAVKVEPGDIFVAGQNLDALIVQANVYSDFGSFGKSSYQSVMYTADTSIVNVYMSDEPLSDINNRDQFISNRNDILEQTTQTFNVVFADMDDNPLTVINPGAKLIINIPREWTFDGFNDYVGFVDPPSWTVHSDGSTQIIGTTIGEIGDGVNDARRISFDAIAPDVKAPRLYVMYVLGDGSITTEAGDDKTIGPLNEIVLNVDPIP